MGQLVKETLEMFGLESMSGTRIVQTHREWGGRGTDDHHSQEFAHRFL
jgi:hypothetical protein